MSGAASFWERRRAGVRAEAEALDASKVDVPEAEAETPKTDAEILEMLKLPDPETMKLGDDFVAFMSKAVPQHIRNRALRTLWRSNPVLACVDGLNDYDDDYLSGSTGNGLVKTTYQVGKGLLAHVQELERQVLAAAGESDAIAEELPEQEPEVQAAVTPEAIQAPEEDVMADNAIEVPAPRRMQFSFEGGAA